MRKLNDGTHELRSVPLVLGIVRWMRGTEDDGAIGKPAAGEPAAGNEIVERFLHRVSGVAIALTADPPTANACGGVGGVRVI